MNTKHLLLTLTFLFAITGISSAQQLDSALMVYPGFVPATIHLSSGKTIKQREANIFLKNSSLLYRSRGNVMEANMANITGVDFDDRHYVKVDTLLCYLVDSVGANRLYCAEVLDVEAYKAQRRNNVDITNLEITDFVNVDKWDRNDESEHVIPIVPRFYYLYSGKFVRVHERDIFRMVPKSRHRQIKTVMSLDGFSWTSPQWLIKVLQAMTSDDGLKP